MNLSDLTVEQYKEWKSEGCSDVQILEKMYYSTWGQPLMTNWKQKNGLIPPRKKRAKNRVLDQLTVKKLAHLKFKGFNNKQIAGRLGVSCRTVELWIDEQKQKGNLPNKKMLKHDWIIFL